MGNTKKTKVFISHSHKDLWLAKLIAGRLRNENINFFLDEEDMDLGDTLTERVKEEIKISTHFLILMTPNATSSKWLTYEIALADAHNIIIVPITQNVDKNQIFEMLLSKPRYDLNDFDKVLLRLKKYKEAEGDVASHKNDEQHEEGSRKNDQVFPNKPAVGELVRLPVKTPEEAIRATENIGWVPGMNPYLGKAGQVVAVDEDDSAKLNVDGGKYWYAFEWLEKVF